MDINKESIEDVFPMSDIQEGMVYHSLKGQEQAVYHNQIFTLYHIDHFDAGILRLALTRMVEKHAILRTLFNLDSLEKPVQIVYKEIPLDVKHVDISHLDREEQRRYLRDFMARDRQEPFKISEFSPLWRIRTFVLHAGAVGFFWSGHHAIMDGWSYTSFITEVSQTYARLKENPGYRPANLKNTYKAYVVEQMILKKDPAIYEFWKKELDGYKRLQIFRDTADPREFHFVKRDVSLPEKLYQGLKNLAQENRTTVKNLCFAAYVYMFSMYAYENDITVGLVTDNRPLCEDGEKILGCFLNTVPVRLKIPAHIGWLDYIRQVDEKMTELKKYDRLPLVDIIRGTGAHQYGQNALFDTIFGYTDFYVLHEGKPGGQTPKEPATPLDYRLPVDGYSATNTIFDFNVDCTHPQVLLVSLNYHSAFVAEEMEKRLLNYFERVLEQFVEQTGSPASKEAILGPGEKRQLLYDFNRFGSDAFEHFTIHGMFETQVDRTPDALAVTFEDRQLTYRALNEKANRLAGELRERGVDRDVMVGLLVERSIEVVIGMLAILKAGGAYLPIDPLDPPDRIGFMLNDSRTPILLTDTSVLKEHSFIELLGLNARQVEPLLTGSRPPADFDRFPINDRSLIDFEKYSRYIGQAMVGNAVSLQPTRGCPFQCVFCHRIWPQKHTFRSAENIYAEIELYYKMGIRRFVLIDDVFNLNVENSTRFFNLIRKNKLDVHLFFPNGLRGDILTRDFIDLMVEVGTVNIDLAIETASPRLQKLIHKNLDLDKLHENMEYICQNYPQVVLDFNMMIGFPTETEEEALMTLDFLKSIHWVHFPYPFILKIHPQTDMGKLALESGISPKAIADSMNYSYQDVPETLPFSRGFAREFKSRYMSEYFMLKERLLHVLPYQMQMATENELIQKYNNYLPMKIAGFSDILDLTGISMSELGEAKFLAADHLGVPGINDRIKKHFPVKKPAPDALKVLLIDISELFSTESREILHSEITEPLGLMSLMSYLQEHFKDQVWGKIIKSRIDFDNFDELKTLVTGFSPDMIGIRTLSNYKDFFHSTVTRIRDWGIRSPIIGGGPYATMDFNIMLQDPQVDLAVIGEGEITLTEVVDRILKNGKKLPGQEVLGQVPGIAFIRDTDKPRLNRHTRQVIALDLIGEKLAGQPKENPEPVNRPEDLVYVVYTSGSTGKPKGVLIQHDNVSNLIQYQYRHTAIDFSRVLQFHNTSFDVAFQEIFSTLLAGGRLSLVDHATRTDLERLFKIVEQHDIKSLFLPMSFLKMIFNEEGAADLIPQSVKHIQAAGEQVVISEDMRRFLAENQVFLHNHYGPAETHVVTAFTVDPGQVIPDLPPIGQPVSNTAITILDRQGQWLAPGAKGELCIAGAQVGRGYLNRPELTAERFVGVGANNYSPLQDNSAMRLYKTGDLARWQADGNLEFLGRIDFQLKIRGFRVEPEEIEQQLLAIDSIKEATVLGKEGKNGEKYLCAYIVSEGTADQAQIQEKLARRLPDYMVPSRFVFMSKLPLTPSGKVDRKALPDPEESAGRVDYAPPQNEIEKALAGIWENVLIVEKPGIDDDFFDIGGNSLKLSQIFMRINAHYQEYPKVVSVQDLFDNRTIKTCAALIAGKIGPIKAGREKIESIEF